MSASSHLDLSTLVVIDILTIIVVSTILLIGRMTLGRASAGSGARVVGDVLLCFANIGALVDVNRAFVPWLDWPVWHVLPAVALPGAMVMAAQWWHARALTIVEGKSVSMSRLLLESLAPAAAWIVVAVFLLNDFDTRHRVLCGFIVAATIPSILPAWRLSRRFWGARIMFATLALSMPLMSLLALGSGPAKDPWTEENLAKSFLFQNVLMLTLTLGFLVLIQEQVRQRLAELSRTDPLTGLLNRRGLLELLVRDLERARRTQRPLSLALFDIDHFKRINDREGHEGGDVVLRRFAEGMVKNSRHGDMAARWGGEEFLLVMPETDANQAAQVAERVRETTRESLLSTSGDRVTVSGGVAEADLGVDGATSIRQLVRSADTMLYRAKVTRDRICTEGTDEPWMPPAAAKSLGAKDGAGMIDVADGAPAPSVA